MSSARNFARAPARALAALVAASLLVGSAVPAQAQIPGLGGLLDRAREVKKLGDAFRNISDDEEAKMGGDLASIILGAAPLLDDGPKQRYVNRVGRWLALHSDRPNLPWKFGILDTPDINAFSMPGGYVLITKGMFDTVRNESELAGVLAHEVAHVVNKDHIAALQGKLRDAALSGYTDYIYNGGGLGGQFKDALLNAGKDLYTQGLNKDDEFDADRMGVVIAARSGYSPYGIGGVLQTLSAAGDDKQLAMMNRTHPLPVERIDRLDHAMGTRLDGITGVVEDLPGFVTLRAPPPPRPPARATPQRRRKGRQG